MPSLVLLTDDAAHDLEETHDYIARHDSIRRARHVLERIESAFASLADSPHRGGYPKELLDLGIREYREVFFKPYRIIYREIEDDVYVLVIADGRRDMRALAGTTPATGAYAALRGVTLNRLRHSARRPPTPPAYDLPEQFDAA